MGQWELKTDKCNQLQARESASDQDVNGSRFESDWLNRWREFLDQSKSVV